MQIVPAVYQLVNGEVKVSSIRPVEIEELLGRESIRMDLAEISVYVKDKIVLVTEEAVLLEANFAGRLRPMERNSSLSLIFMKIMPTILNRSFAENTLP